MPHLTSNPLSAVGSSNRPFCCCRVAARWVPIRPAYDQALAEAGLQPDWVAGISIGAINAALIAGDPPDRRVERLREFWEAVSTPPLGLPQLSSIDIENDAFHQFVNQTRALGIMMFGAPHFFTPRMLSPAFWPSANADQLSIYDVAPLQATLKTPGGFRPD